MSNSGPVRERLAIDGGEARLVDITPIDRAFEVELGQRLFVAEWYPRDSASLLFIKLEWRQPQGVALTPAETTQVLDALWALAPLARGVSAIIEERPRLHIVHRWDRPTGFMVHVAWKQAIEYVELGRTMSAPYLDRSSGSLAIAEVRSADARWVYPVDAPLDEADWARVKARLVAAKRSDFFMTDYAWKIEVIECP